MRALKLQTDAFRPTVPPSQKKSPRQSRSKFTLNIILEAAEQLLQSGGVAAVTTRRVALRAGVGISTLYDYFPNRDAILIQLVNRIMEKRHEEMIPKFEASLEKSLPELFKMTADYAVATDWILLQFGEEFHSRYARFFHFGTYDLEINGAARKRKLGELERGAYKMLSNNLEQVGEADIELAAFLLSRVVRDIMNSVVQERPKLVQSPSFLASLERIMLAIANCPKQRETCCQA